MKILVLLLYYNLMAMNANGIYYFRNQIQQKFVTEDTFKKPIIQVYLCKTKLTKMGNTLNKEPNFLKFDQTWKKSLS